MQKRWRIMIIDDDRCICDALRDRLDALGYEAISFTDGCSALATIALESSRSPFDLVLLDLHMPGMDGMAVLGELHHQHRKTPVIIMSATSEREAFADAIRAGARDFLKKPIDSELLHQKCRTIFENGDIA
jgi:DNA-binding NtrC family response regulator